MMRWHPAPGLILNSLRQLERACVFLLGRKALSGQGELLRTWQEVDRCTYDSFMT